MVENYMVINMSSDQLNEEMKKLATSDNPVDIARLLTFGGYPLVIKKRTSDYATIGIGTLHIVGFD
jgi:hypothetical protein